MPSAPDWQKNPTRPGGGTTGASVAFSRTAGSVFTSPEAVRAEHPHAVRPASATMWRAPAPPAAPPSCRRRRTRR